MNANDYQELAGRTLLKEPDQMPNYTEWLLMYNALHQAMVSGKTVETLKKQICHRQGLNLPAAINSLTRIKEQPPIHFPSPTTITDGQYMLVWNLMGLIGEVAEFCESLFFNISPGFIEQEKATKELGDVLWYVAALCTKLNLSMSDVMQHNIDKLKARYPEGYNSKDSINRAGLAE